MSPAAAAQHGNPPSVQAPPLTTHLHPCGAGAGRERGRCQGGGWRRRRARQPAAAQGSRGGAVVRGAREGQHGGLGGADDVNEDATRGRPLGATQRGHHAVCSVWIGGGTACSGGHGRRAGAPAKGTARTGGHGSRAGPCKAAVRVARRVGHAAGRPGGPASPTRAAALASPALAPPPSAPTAGCPGTKSTVTAPGATSLSIVTLRWSPPTSSIVARIFQLTVEKPVLGAATTTAMEPGALPAVTVVSGAEGGVAHTVGAPSRGVAGTQATGGGSTPSIGQHAMPPTVHWSPVVMQLHGGAGGRVCEGPVGECWWACVRPAGPGTQLDGCGSSSRAAPGGTHSLGAAGGHRDGLGSGRGLGFSGGVEPAHGRSPRLAAELGNDAACGVDVWMGG